MTASVSTAREFLSSLFSCFLFVLEPPRLVFAINTIVSCCVCILRCIVVLDHGMSCVCMPSVDGLCRLLDAILDICGCPAEKFRSICSAIDKLDKATWTEVRLVHCHKAAAPPRFYFPARGARFLFCSRALSPCGPVSPASTERNHDVRTCVLIAFFLRVMGIWSCWLRTHFEPRLNTRTTRACKTLRYFSPP